MKDSRGAVREDSAGARSRALFKTLPNVGQMAAQHWWELGLT